MSRHPDRPGNTGHFSGRWRLVLVLCLVLFGAYVLVCDHLTQKAAEKRLAAHSRVIAAALWHYNLDQSAGYLTLARDLEHYQSLVIYDDLGTAVLTQTSPPSNRWERFLERLHLIRSITLTAPIHYSGRFIGTLVVQWRLRSVYQHVYIFVALALGLAVAYLYAGVLRAKGELTARVASRTAELQTSNESLQAQVRERQRAETALRQSEETYRTILDSIDATIYVADMESHEVLFMNSFMREAFGGDQVGKVCWHVFRQGEGPCGHCSNDKLLNADGSPAETRVWEAQNPLNQRWYLNYDRAVPWMDGRMVRLQIATDITTNKQLEEKRQRAEQQLQQAQKLEAIGTLAGGIAHDFNNLMMGMMGNVNLMMYDMDPEHPHHQKLARIEQQIESGAKLTHQLLGYARKGAYEIRPLNINTLVKECAETFGRTRKQIRIHLNMKKSLWGSQADWTQIEQVLLNLFINAGDAMPDGGDLFLKTDNCAHSDITGRPFRPKPGAYVAIKVADTGVGMPPEVRERIFDPFFTTKEMGRGTGLGLASAYGIVKGHGGYIDVVSTPGEGTAFTIYLPAIAEIAPKCKVTRKQLLHHGEGTILLVDDEEVVLSVGHQMLDKLGYTVLPARSGADALQLFTQHLGRIDLVILDMVMPDMGGSEVFQGFQELGPEVPVLLASGYSREGKAEELIERGCRGFIQKPFSIITLGETVSAILKANTDLPN